MFLNNRYHDPTLGVFVSVNPLVTITGEPYIYGGGNPITYSDPSGLCVEPNSLVFSDDGSYTYTPMGGKECFNWTDHDVTGGNVETPGFDGGYGVKSVPGSITHGPGGAFTGLPPTLGSVAKITGLVYGSAALGAAAGAAPGLAGSVSSTCLRFAFWCTRLAGAGSAGANAVNETFGGPGSGSSLGVADDAWRYATAPNKFNHYFQARHKFDPLVAELGSEQAVLRAVLVAVQREAPQSGVFTRLNVNVLGRTVETSGYVDDGVVKLGDMWIP